MTVVALVAQLRAIDPRLPYLLTAAVCGLLVWLWKTASPKTFEQVPPRARALPAAAIGAILTAGSTESLHTLLVDLVFGAFAGVTAVGGHETLRRLALGPQEATAAPPPAPTPQEAEAINALKRPGLETVLTESLYPGLVYGKADKPVELPPAAPPEPGDPATE